MKQPHIAITVSAPSISLSAIGAIEGLALQDVARARVEQIDVHGYTPTHDYDHAPGEIAMAAYAYATMGLNLIDRQDSPDVQSEAHQYWPWMSGWKPAPDARGNLVKAAALMLATIDRLDVTMRESRLAEDEAA